MSMQKCSPTGKEIFFPENDFIVSKTDLKGKITYTNALFEKMSGYNQQELLGQPHNIIRHPHMPRCIFQLFWDTIQQQKEIFAYVINMHRNGDHYWVLAHVVPTYDLKGNHMGYHSTRRCPNKQTVQKIQSYYQELFDIENRASNHKQGTQDALDNFNQLLSEHGVSYGEYIFSMNNAV